MVVNRLSERWKIDNQKFRAKDAEKADRLTHEAREKGASWNSFTMMEGSKLESVRACFDGGVSKQEDRKVKQKVGSAYVIQASKRIERGSC